MNCHLCGVSVAGPLRAHLEASHPNETWWASLRDEELIGTARRVCYALAIWPTDVVSRATIRSLLPEGKRRDVGIRQHLRKMQSGGTGRVNTVTHSFQNALAKLERDGMLQRGEEFILIRDRRALLDRAIRDVKNPQHSRFIEIARAADLIAEQLHDEQRPRVRAQREAELRFIRSLMEAPFGGSMRSGSRAVRIIPANPKHAT